MIRNLYSNLIIVLPSFFVDKQELKLDLDVRQIGMLMEVGAYTAAENMINRGQNSVVADENGSPSYYRSIKDIATDEAYSFILNVTNEEQPFDDISGYQARGLVKEVLQSMVGYNASLSKVQDAVGACSNNQTKSPISQWEGALAYLVGSIEGPETGGNFDEQGQMLYALAKENCFKFSTCAEDGDSKLNKELLTLFREGKNELVSRSCSDLSITAQKIESTLQTVLIQSTLRFALDNADLESESESEDLARGYVILKSIFPALENVDLESAATIERNMAFPLVSDPVPDGSEAVFEAFAKIIPLMNGIDCAEVGSVSYGDFEAGVCPVNDGDESTADPGDLTSAVNNVVDQEAPHEISNGLYITSSNVKDRLVLSQPHDIFIFYHCSRSSF